jgi:hypothetical protein
MDINLYSKLIQINNKTFTKMKYMLNEDGVWVPTDQRGAHVEEENDAKKEKNILLVVMISLKRCLRHHQ